jgi:hypothetical protein
MKNALWDRGSYFKGNPNKVVEDIPGIPEPFITTNRTRHPIMGQANSRYTNVLNVRGNVYDVTTGSILTREQLLTLDFFYDGTLTRVPPEICLWMAMKEADISLSWDSLSVAQLVKSGYSYFRNVEGERERIPETDYNRAGVYLPNNPVSAPTSQHPYMSVFSLFNDDPMYFTFSNPRRAIHGGVMGIDRQSDGTVTFGFREGGFFILSESDYSVGSVSETQEVDTGIPLGDEGNTFKLQYNIFTGVYDKETIFSSEGYPYYLTDYKVWVAPVAGSGGFLDAQKETVVGKGGAYAVLYPEYREELDAIEESLQADDVIINTAPIPVGISRISLYPPSAIPEEGYYTGPMTVSAKVTKQMPRFLSGQV